MNIDTSAAEVPGQIEEWVGDNLSRYQGQLCAYTNFPPLFVSNAKQGGLTLQVNFSWIKKSGVKSVCLSAVVCKSCQLYLCSAEALGLCPGQQGVKTKGERQYVSNGAVLWRGQREGALLHIKANKWD